MSLIPSGTTITVETKYFPPLVVDLSPGAPGAKSGLGGMVTSLLKPKVTVALHGAVQGRVAPYGEPTPNQWPTVKIVLAVAAALAVFSVLRVLR